jgi:glycosyltransferase involved in cell wall biosynthesis
LGYSKINMGVIHLTEKESKLLHWDSGFQTEIGRQNDVLYQALQKGFIQGTYFNAYNVYSIFDNYCFLRKYYHPLWSWYVLLVRLITFHNPFTEIQAWLSNRRVQRVNLFYSVYPHEKNYLDYISALLASAPKVSVIIPTLNRYTYLADVLKDLEKQDYRNFEVVVIDQSDPYREDFYTSFNLSIKLIRQKEKALWLARNEAIKAASSEWILLSEDDVRIPTDWISNHLKCLDFFNADISTGVFFPEGTNIPISRSFFQMAEQFSTGNCCLKKDVFKKIGLFDRQFEKQRMGDGEFGLRAYLAGLKSISNPYAYCVDIKAPVGGLRQMGSWDSFRPKNWWAPRPIPSVLYYYRKYYPKEWVIWGLVIGVLPSIIPYQFKRSKSLMVLGSLLSLLLLPLIGWQVWRSWQLSSQKLKEGPKIDSL